MSDPMNPVAPAGRARPSSVTISTWLLFLVAALQLVGAIVGLSVMGTMADAYNEAYKGTDLEDGGDFLAGATIVGGAVLGLLFAIGLVILAIFNNRGKNVSRIITWVVGGLLLCCSGFGLLGQLAGGSMNFGGGGENMPDSAEVQKAVNDALPSWYLPVAGTIGVLGVLALATALILLALPPSNEHFRKRQPVWEPPVPGHPGYQAQPAYPPPGAPPASPPGPPPGNPPGSPRGTRQGRPRRARRPPRRPMTSRRASQRAEPAHRQAPSDITSEGACPAIRRGLDSGCVLASSPTVRCPQ